MLWNILIFYGNIIIYCLDSKRDEECIGLDVTFYYNYYEIHSLKHLNF